MVRVRKRRDRIRRLATQGVVAKSSRCPLNERQQKIPRFLLGAFEGKLASGKWAKARKVSSDTALHDINGLIAKELLKCYESAGS